MTTRCARRSALWAASAAVVLGGLMTACSSDDDPDPVPDPTPTPVEKTIDAVTVGNDPAAQAYRFTYYKAKLALRDAAEPSVYPELEKEAPTPKAGTPEFNNLQEVLQAQGDAHHAAYILKGGNGQLSYWANTKIYVQGTVTVNNFQCEDWTIQAPKVTVYVPAGSKLILNGGNFNGNITVKVWGDVEVQGGVTLADNSTLLVKESITFPENLTVSGTLVVGNELTVNKKMQVNNQNARVKAKCIAVNGTGLDYNDECLNMANGAEMRVLSYLYTPKFYNQGGHVFMAPNGMVDVPERLKMTANQGAFFEYYFSEGKTDGHALVKTTKFEVEGSSDDPTLINQMFSGNVKLIYTELVNMQQAWKDRFLPSADDFYIAKDSKGCNPGNGHNVPWFDPIVLIETPQDGHTHTHLSATCVQPVNGSAYVSYHLNEAYTDLGQYVAKSKRQGCVEKIEVTDEKAQITSWMMNDNFDFNHLLVKDNVLYTIGDHNTKAGKDIKEGAVGKIALESNGSFGQHEIGDNAGMTVKGLNAESGNCIVADGANFRVATTNGFKSLNSSLELSTDSILTTGVGKHIAADGQRFATLNLTTKNAGASDAQVTLYTPWGTATKTFSVGQITPVNGKNVVALNGNDVYVCCGQNGVKKFDANGNEQGHFSWIEYETAQKPDYKGKPCANGLAVDDKYVYVAYGEAGLVVLDKTTLNKVARYSHLYDEVNKKGYSANYVQLVGGRIYIAYGRSGLEVVKLHVPQAL